MGENDHDQEVVEYVEPTQAVGKPLPSSAESTANIGLLPWQMTPHVLTHLPRLAQCPVCARALAKKKPSRCKLVPVEDEADIVEKKLGLIITADQIVNKHHVDMPQHDKTVALVMHDRGTQWIGAFPRKSRALDQTISSCQQFVGPHDTAQLFYSDAAPEFIQALHWRHQTATPARPQTNSVAERAVQTVLRGARAVLNAAGVSTKWLPKVVRYYAVAHNATKTGADGMTPWQRRHGEHFPALLIPLGALVDFLPTPKKDGSVYDDKQDARMKPGLFAGWKLAPGGRWTGIPCRRLATICGTPS